MKTNSRGKKRIIKPKNKPSVLTASIGMMVSIASARFTKLCMLPSKVWQRMGVVKRREVARRTVSSMISSAAVAGLVLTFMVAPETAANDETAMTVDAPAINLVVSNGFSRELIVMQDSKGDSTYAVPLASYADMTFNNASYSERISLLESVSGILENYAASSALDGLLQEDDNADMSLRDYGFIWQAEDDDNSGEADSIELFSVVDDKVVLSESHTADDYDERDIELVEEERQELVKVREAMMEPPYYEPIYEVYKDGRRIDVDPEWQHLIRALCREYGYPEGPVYGMILTESSFNPDAHNPNGWRGLAQFAGNWVTGNVLKESRIYEIEHWVLPEPKDRNVFNPIHNIVCIFELWEHGRKHLEKQGFDSDPMTEQGIYNILYWHNTGGIRQVSYWAYNEKSLRYAGELVEIIYIEGDHGIWAPTGDAEVDDTDYERITLYDEVEPDVE